MMVFFKANLVYLAVPKTGTSAIELALGSQASVVFNDPPGLKHTNANGFERNFRPVFARFSKSGLETCAVMRHPVDWLGSWYRYRQRTALSGHANSTAGMDFDYFVAAYLAPEQPAFAQVGSQGRFISSSGNELLVNHLFQYEQLHEFHAFLMRRLAVEFATKTVNSSPSRSLSLSAELEQELRQRYARDFAIHEALDAQPISLG